MINNKKIRDLMKNKWCLKNIFNIALSLRGTLVFGGGAAGRIAIRQAGSASVVGVLVDWLECKLHEILKSLWFLSSSSIYKNLLVFRVVDLICPLLYVFGDARPSHR